MTDPFVQGLPPTRVGHARIDQNASLYFEVRGPHVPQQRILMIMGAFATSRKFDCIASEMAEAGYEVRSIQTASVTHLNQHTVHRH